jgi:mono/diheme cytochrome c family protein
LSRMRVLILMLAAASILAAAEPAVIEKGRAEEKQSCVACHGLRIIHSQRLSRGVWERELDKMAKWGAAVKDRESLLEYLVANYGDDKPVPAPVRSGDGRKVAER